MPLVAEKKAERYDKHKARVAKNQRAQSEAGRNIGPIPPVRNPERRKAIMQAEDGFRIYCEEYHPNTFVLDWSDDHLKAISIMNKAAIFGGLFAFAMPRGKGKTSLSEVLAEFATFTGRRRYVPIIASNAGRSEDLLASIKTEIETNDELLDDFPEICFPIREIGRIVSRAAGQLYFGQPTRIIWTSKKIVLPTIPGSPASGAIMTACGLEGSDIRGQKHKLTDGSVIRPDMAVIDDPQTTESAWSPMQCDRRERLVSADILGMAGPGKKISAIMPCTVIAENDLADRMLDHTKHPDWQGYKTKMVYSFPANEKLWNEYATIRNESLEIRGDIKSATDFYSENREAMDEGAEISWKERFNEDELSAIQHAMNLKLRDESAFWSEYQNEPMKNEDEDSSLTIDEVLERVSSVPRFEVPTNADFLTAFFDVHDRVIFYTVAAWQEETFSGWVVDYGTWPEQGRPYFIQSKAPKTLSMKYPGTGIEAAIFSGVKDALNHVVGKSYIRTDGAVMHIGHAMVDAGYKPDVVKRAIRACDYPARVMPSIGIGVKATGKPFHEVRKKPGERRGHYWRVPRPNGKRDIRGVQMDVNYWKSFVHSRIAVPVGDPSGLLLFGIEKERSSHQLFSEHIVAEYSVQVIASNQGRTVNEWAMKPGLSENHWFDCLVGCTVGASMLGARLPGLPNIVKQKKKRARRKMSDLQRDRRSG